MTDIKERLARRAMTDLITRLIAGPGSRELDLAVEMECGLVELRPEHKRKFMQYRSTQTGALSNGPFRSNLTTSIDAAVSFAMSVVGTQKAIQAFRDAQDKAWVGPTGWFDALPRYIVAEVLKARGDD